ncbi:MAG: 23S rRNA (pseudouridine(1915)-N(3))-methyltransferase RlmH [Oscillospiraceae bacterium]
MVHLTVLAVGKLKDRWMSDGVAEYLKRMNAYCKPEIIEIDEHRLPQNPSAALIEKGLEAEGEAILARIPPRAHVIALCIEGKQRSSEELAEELGHISGEASQVVFVIGSSHGLAEKVKTRADGRLSLSQMTFPHQLTRLVLCEQLYRALSINAGGKYHK